MKNPVVLQLSFYYKNCDRLAAENKLKEYPPGTFLLRPSSEPSDVGHDYIVLSFVNKNCQIRHDLINVDVSLNGRVVDLTLLKASQDKYGTYDTIFDLINQYPLPAIALLPYLEVDCRFSKQVLIQQAIANINKYMVDEYGYSGLLPKPPMVNKRPMLPLQESDVILLDDEKVRVKIYMLSNHINVPEGRNPRHYADPFILEIARPCFDAIAYLARKLYSHKLPNIPYAYVTQTQRSNGVPWLYRIPLSPKKLSEQCINYIRRNSKLFNHEDINRLPKELAERCSTSLSINPRPFIS